MSDEDGTDGYSRRGRFPRPEASSSDGTSRRRRFHEFFAANIRNKNTRDAYARDVRNFLDWAESRGVRRLDEFRPLVVAGYIEDLATAYEPPTVKQHVAAIRMLFDWLVVGQIVAAGLPPIYIPP